MGGVGIAADVRGDRTLVSPGNDIAKFNGKGFWLITGGGNKYSLDSWRHRRLGADTSGSAIGNKVVDGEIDEAADEEIDKDHFPERIFLISGRIGHSLT